VYPRRVAQTRYRGRPVECCQVHGATMRAAVTRLEDLPSRSRPRQRCYRSIHCADHRLQAAVWVGDHQPWATPPDLDQRHNQPNARQITEAFPWEQAPHYLIRDRDGSYGAIVRNRIQVMGTRDRPTAPRSPWQNGHIERLIGSIRRECLDHVVILSEPHLAGSSEHMLTITIAPVPISRSTRTPLSLASCRRLDQLRLSLSSAAFTPIRPDDLNGRDNPKTPLKR